MTVVQVSAYAPDQPDAFDGDSTDVANNCLPRTVHSYGPMPSLSSSAAVLTARAQGAVGVQDLSGNSILFAGDATKLYKLAGGGSSWSNVSKAALYSTSSAERWSFAYFNGQLIATNFTDAMQTFTLASSTLFADLSATAPKARYVAALSKGFLVAANTFDAVTGNAPQRVWWSAFGDCTSWPTPGSNAALAVQSDYQDIIGDHGWCQGIVGNLASADAVIFFERAVFRMQYAGGGTFFQFSAAEGVRGTPAPGSIVQLGAIVYYLGEDGFYAFDGSSSKAIGAGKVDKTFLADMDQTQFARISSAVDPVNKLVFWAYPGASNTSGNPNKILAYNWELDRWSLIDSVNVEILFRALTLGYTLEQLDAAFGTSIDAFTFSLDSRALTGGRLLLAAFDTSHQLGYFNGSNMAATIDSQEGQIFPRRRAMIRSVRPLIDGGTPSIAVATRDRTMDSLTYGSAVAVNSIGECPQRVTGRMVRARMTIPAASTWTHCSGFDVDARPEGKR